MGKNDEVIQYSRSFLHTPYVWGGNNVLQGFDCSGFVCEVLRSFGLVGQLDDLNAQTLFLKLCKSSNYGPSTVYIHPSFEFTPGAILFFGASIQKITHVSICVDGFRMIEAGGGGKECISKEIAAKIGAMVRESMVSHRVDLVAGVIPQYPQ